MKKKIGIIMLIIIVACSVSRAWAQISIVAAENFYGSIAQQIGGHYISVTNILNNPNQDPHLFSASPSTAKALATAQVIIYSGVDYDPWMSNLLNAQDISEKKIINVGELVGVKAGSNPHIWYNPNYMLIYARKLTDILSTLDPQQRQYYQERFQAFKKNNDALLAKIATFSKKANHMSVTATEPVFGYMADLLGLNMLGLTVQWQIMNDASPSPQEIKDYENNIRERKVRILFYNNQVIDPLTDEIQEIARQHHIPVVGVSETLPLRFNTYHQWMSSQLDELKVAIN